MPTLESITTTSPYLTPAQVAAKLNISLDTVTAHFDHREGVIDMGTPERMHTRRKRLLRIPEHALEAYITERQVRVRRR